MSMEIEIKSYLRSLPSEELLFIPNPGNGGDALIAWATMRLFRELGIKYKVCGPDVDAANRIVLYGGGGMFVERYNFAANVLRRIHQQAKKVVVLPHTISGHEETIRSFGSNVDVICREHPSVSHVRATGTAAHVYLCHDLALTISLPVLLDNKQLKDKTLQRELDLRMGRKWYYRGKIIGWLGGQRKKCLYCFRTDGEMTDVKRPPENLDLTDRVNYDRTQRDEALVEKTAFNIVYYLQKYDIIHTNRLHVAIPSALMGKEVYLYPNDYRKIENVFDYSLKNRFSNVHWMHP